MKKAIMTGALILGTTLGLTTATLAQGYYGGPYDRPGYGYGSGPYEYNQGPAVPDVDRGGPGPRVGSGSGAGIGAER
jgi:hypothetical protein